MARSREVDGMTVEKFMTVSKKILRNIAVDGLLHGNCDGADAETCGNMIVDLLKKTAGEGRGSLPGKKKPSAKISRLPKGGGRLLVAHSKNVKDPNTSVEHYYQIGPDNLEDAAMVDLIVQLMDEPFYDQVRTKEQFGYSVSCSEKWTGGVIGLSLKIVSAVKTAKECSDRIDKFVGSFLDDVLGKMKDEEFLENMVGLARNKLSSWNMLSEYSGHLYEEILSYRGSFETLREEVIALKSLTRGKVAKFFASNCSSPGSSRVMKVWVCGEGGGVTRRRSREDVEKDIGKYLGEVQVYDAVYSAQTL